MTKPIETKVTAPIDDARHPQNMRALLLILADAAHSFPPDHSVVLTVTQGWDDAVGGEAANFILTASPP